MSNENGIRPNIDISNQFLEEGDLTEPELEEDEDLHVCKKCNLAFRDIQKYLAHKVKHDNFKIKYCRSEVDKRMIMPKLVYKSGMKKEPVAEPSPAKFTEEKENSGDTVKKKRGRKKIVESIDQELVIKDKPVYVCIKCDRKFNREATLRRHSELEHEGKNDDDDDDDVNDDDDDDIDDEDDVEYKPSVADIKAEITEDNQDTDEMPPLTAEEMADVGHVDRVVVIPPDGIVPPDGVIVIRGHRFENDDDDDGEDHGEGDEPVLAVTDTELNGETVSSTEDASAENSDQSSQATVQDTSPVNVVRGPRPPKRQKPSSDDDGDSRKYACTVCGNKFKEIAILKTHMLVHSTAREFVCEAEGCTYAFKTKGSLRRHMRRHTGERPFPCELCGRTFVESGALTRHLRSRVPCTAKSDNDLPRYGKRWSHAPNIAAKQPQEPQVQQPTSTQSYAPVVQQAGTAQLGQLKDTIEAGQIAELSSPTSGDTLATVVQVIDADLPADERNLIKAVIDNVDDGAGSEFVQNEMEVDSESISTVCRVCKEDSFTVEALNVHLRTHLADEALKCWLCHFITDDKDQYTEHMFTQHAVQLQTSDPFTTLVVADSEEKGQRDLQKDAQIAVKQLLELPTAPTEGEDSDKPELSARLLYKCLICMRKFRGSNYLKLHMRNHTGVRPHKCQHCEKSFITKDTLNKHMHVHADDRNFKCGECGKLFKRLSHVREHIKTHSSARLFPCHICEKAFKTNNAMKVHLRTHTDILPYVCNFCHRRFREKGSVIRHKRTHTGEKPYQCRHCGRGFAEHGTLNRHLKAKVSCKKSEEEENREYPNMLAEFSSVVADTQQYIVPASETTVDSSLIQDEAQQAAEYVVVTDLENQEFQQIENVEIVSTADGTNQVEGVQVSDNFVVITDPETGGMKIIDNRSGETVAFVPMVNADGEGDGNQTVLVSADMGTEIETIEMDL